MDTAEPITAELIEVSEGRMAMLWSNIWSALILGLVASPGAVIWWWALTGMMSLLR